MKKLADRKDQRAIQGDDCCPRRRSWSRFPLIDTSILSWTLSSRGVSVVDRVSDQGRLAEV
jgi:hypothetical protein